MKKQPVTICFLLGSAWICSSLLAAPTPTPAPVATKADIAYGPEPHQVLDIYAPPDGGGPFPVLLWFGGLFGNARRSPPDLPPLYSHHCAVIAVELRSLGDATAAQPRPNPPISWPLSDARRALQFVRLHAAEWNLDPERIATGGNSQGTLPALYVACAGEQANPQSTDPVERVSTKVLCVGAFNSQPSIDPKVMQEWVPGVEWGPPALADNFADTLRRRNELLPSIQKWSPDALLKPGTPPIYFFNSWGLVKPATTAEMEYKVHSPLWALGFQKLAEARGFTCYVNFPGHPSRMYNDMWDFLIKEMTAPPRSARVGATEFTVPRVVPAPVAQTLVCKSAEK